MNVSGISNSGALGKALRLPLRLIPSNAVLPILQGPIRGKKWIAGSANHGCWLGSYESDKQQLFCKLISKGSIVFDIGANVGYYTLLSSSIVGSTGWVIAFEPLPKNIEHLKKHIALNNLMNVSVVEAAVSDISGTALFEEGPNQLTGKISTNGRLAVDTLGLDEAIAAGNLPIPDAIKIDAEGGELAILKGARQMLAGRKPTLFLATHGLELHRDCCKLLVEFGYSLQPIGSKPLEKSDELIATKSVSQ